MKKIMIMLTFLMVFAGTANAAQLLSNPSFEGTGTGSLDGWTVAFNPVSAYATNLNPSQGSYNLRTHYDIGVYQDVAVVGGTAYTTNGDNYIPAGGAAGWSAWFNLQWLDNSKVKIGADAYSADVLTGATRGVYNTYTSGSLTAPSNAAYARVNLGVWMDDGKIVGADPIDWDNFALNGETPIPEPTSMLLLGSGLVGLFGVTRKKRS